MKRRFLSVFVLLFIVASLLCSCAIHKGSFAFSPNFESRELTLTMYSGAERDVTVPKSHWGMPVSAIGERAFPSSSAIKSITLPDTVREIMSLAFENCRSLESIDLSSSLEIIRINAFKNCTALETVILPASVEKIEPRAFSGCTALKKFEVAASNPKYRAIDGHLYDKNILVACAAGSVKEEFAVSDGAEGIAAEVFADCSTLCVIHLPASLKSIDAKAFEGCGSIREIRFAGTAEEWRAIGENIDFSGCVSIICSNGTLSGN